MLKIFTGTGSYRRRLSKCFTKPSFQTAELITVVRASCPKTSCSIVVKVELETAALAHKKLLKHDFLKKHLLVTLPTEAVLQWQENVGYTQAYLVMFLHNSYYGFNAHFMYVSRKKPMNSSAHLIRCMFFCFWNILLNVLQLHMESDFHACVKDAL